MSKSLFSDGKEYISATRASEKSGYASDYIGQLCRAKKLPSQLIGRTWYVELNSLLNHKKNSKPGKTKKILQAVSINNLDEISKVNSYNKAVFKYESESAPRLPELIKKPVLRPRTLTKALVSKAVALSLILLFSISAGFACFEFTDPKVAFRSEDKLTSAFVSLGQFSAGRPGEYLHEKQLAAAGLFGEVNYFFETVGLGFSGLKTLAFSKVWPQTPSLAVVKTTPVEKVIPTKVAITSATPTLNLEALKKELKVELENYLQARISSAQGPAVIYSSAPATSIADFESFRNYEVLPAISHKVTQQSNSDVDLLATRLSQLTQDGLFTKATFDTICFSHDTCENAWPVTSGGGGGTGDGSAFPFDLQTWGVSTSTTLGFLSGLLSTASSTFAGDLHMANATSSNFYTNNLMVGSNLFTVNSSGVDVNTATDISGDLTISGGAALTISATGPINQTGTGQVTFAGNVDATNGLDVTNANFTVGGSKFSVAPTTGNTAVGGILDIVGAIRASSTLQATGAARFYSTLRADGSITAAGTGTGLSVTNNATIGGTLNLTGAGTFGSSLDITGALSAASLTLTSGTLSLNNQKITGLADPTTAQEAATKNYVDAVAQGLDLKESVAAGTTANIVLSGEQTIDGVPLVIGDRVLVKDQSDRTKNGIYVVAGGSWARSTDADENSEVSAGLFTFIQDGTINASSGWVLTTSGSITLGSSLLDFTQFSGAGQIVAGTGMTKSANTLNVVGTANRITANADSIDIASTYVGQNSLTTVGTLVSGSIGNGFGDIDIGSSSLNAGSATFASITGSAITGSGSLTVGGAASFSSDLSVSGTLNANTATFSGNIALGGNKITGLANPTSAQEAATKAYVDAIAQGLNVKASVRLATTSNVTLSGEQDIDGVAAVAGNRVLLMGQSTGSQNGIYTVSLGAWSRSTDADENSEVVAGTFAFVEEGTTNANTGWSLITANPITLATTALTFTQFSGSAEVIAGNGLTKSGTTINAVGTANRISVTADAIDISASYVGQSSITTTGALSSGSIVNGFGLINIGSSALTAGAANFQSAISYGTLSVGGTATTSIVGNSATSTFSGGISLASGNVNLATNGNFLVNNSLLLNAVTLGSSVVGSSLQSVGALDSGSITTGFGDINIGANTLDAGTTTIKNLVVQNTSTSTFAGPISNTSGNLIIAPTGTTNNLLLNPYGGNVGIGTSSPFAKLSVSGNLFVNGNATSSNSYATTASSSDLFSSTLAVGGNGLVVNSSRNVGIGTASPNNLLQVNSGATPLASQVKITANNSGGLSLLNYAPGTSELTFDADYSGGSWVARNTTSFALAAVNDRLEFKANGSLTDGNAFTQSTAMVIDQSGNIGIGTSAPAGIFDVNSKLTVLSTGPVGISTTTPFYNLTIASTTGSQLSLSAGAGIAQWAFRNAGGNFYLATTTVGGTATSTTAALTVNSNGFLGIGTTSPTSRLSVNGDSYTGGIARFNDGTYSMTIGGAAGEYRLQGGFTSGPQFRFLDSGNSYGKLGFYSLSLGNTYGSLDAPTSGAIIEGSVGIGTSTPTWLLNPSSATAAQLALSAGAGFSQWAFRNAGGSFFLATTTVAGTATSTISTLSINANGIPTFASLGGTTGCAQFSSTGALSNLGSACASFAFPVTADTYGGVVVNSTTTGLWLKGTPLGLIASSTFSTLSTSTSATSTNFFATTASSTNLVSSLLTVGGTGLVVDSTKNVGIGIATPGNLLQINSGATPSASQLRASANGAGSISLLSYAAGNSAIAFDADFAATSWTARNSTVFMIAGESDVLDFRGNAGLSNGSTFTPTSFMTLNTSGFLGIGDTRPDAMFEISGSLSTNDLFMISSNDDNDGDRFIVKSSGFIGVGTTTPDLAQFSIASSTGQQMLLSAGANFGEWAFRNAGGNLYFSTTTLAGSSTTTIPAFVIASSTGNIGIGTNTPGHKLSVLGNANFIASSSAVLALTQTGTGDLLALKNHLPGSNTLAFKFAPNELGSVLVPKSSLEIRQKSTIAWQAKSSWVTGIADTGDFSAPAMADLDNDGDLDMLIGDSSGVMLGYENTGNATFPIWVAKTVWNLSGVTDNAAAVSFADMDNDGDYDLMIGSNSGTSNGTVFGYENTGTVTNPRWVAKSGWNTADTGNGAVPTLADLDNDGDYDLLIGSTAGTVLGYENTGSPLSPTWSAKTAWNSTDIGDSASPTVADLDNDGDYDLIIGDNAGQSFANENIGGPTGATFVAKAAWDLTTDVGFNAKPIAADIDNDGDYDLIVGSFTGANTAYENTGSTNSTFFTQNGFVGHGTSTPQFALTIFATTTSQLALSAGAGAAQWTFRGVGGNLYFSTTTVAGTATTSGTSALTLKSAGTVFLNPGLGTGTGGNYLCIDTTTYEVLRGNGVTCTSSSVRFKENIADIQYGLSEVLQLRPVSYNYKEGTNMGEGTKLGFIAEEVDTLIPEIVTHDADGQIFGLDYPVFTAVLTKAIQELDANLEAVSSSTASSTPESTLFAESFFHNLFNRVTTWLADATNGITEFFANRVHTKELCVSDESGSETCITKAELDSLLGNAVSNMNSGGGSNTPIVEPNPEPDASSTPEIITEPEASSTPEIISEPEASSTPEVVVETVVTPEPETPAPEVQP